jgi:Retrotransposon gag protein
MAAREARAARRGTVAALNPDNHPQDNQPHHHQAPSQRLIGDIVREENRVRRKEREPPLFRGEAHEDAVDWLLRYEEIAHYNEWNVDEQLHNFGIHLEGVARRWYLSLIPAPLNFPDLRARFLVAFKPPNYDIDLETKLLSRYQEGHEPVITYCHDVIYLCSCVDRNMGDPLNPLSPGTKPVVGSRSILGWLSRTSEDHSKKNRKFPIISGRTAFRPQMSRQEIPGLSR